MWMKLEYVNGQSSAKSHERTNMDSTGRFAVDCKAGKDSPRGSPKRAAAGFFAIPTHFRASSNKLVHAAPQYLRYFLDGQHTGFYVTVFPAADILDPASDGLGKLSPGHACSLTGSLSFISHFYPSFLQFDFLFLAAWGVAPTFS